MKPGSTGRWSSRLPLHNPFLPKTMIRFSPITGQGWNRHELFVFWGKSSRAVDDFMRLRGHTCYYSRRRRLQGQRTIHPASMARFSNRGGGDGDARSGSDSSKDSSPKFRLPPPTWSVSDLQLSVNHEPVSDEVLVALCRRACVRVPPTATTTTTKTNESDNREEETSMRQMAQDVGNLLHMLRQVQSIDPNLAASLLDSKGDDERARLLYDVPRGVSPIVFDGSTNGDDSDGRSESSRAPNEGHGGDATANASSHRHDEDAMEFDRVRESLLRPKMVQVGGHSYFAVRTGRPRTLAEGDADTNGSSR
jgi:hypothetical protein